MDKREYIISLYEEYKELFTEKQKLYFYHYYFEDLSLVEISELYNVSKSIVGKTINIVESKLLELENKLGLYKKYLKLKNITNKITNDQIKKELEELL